MCGSMVDIQFATAENRREKKQETGRKKETTAQNIMACPEGGHNQHVNRHKALSNVRTSRSQ